MNKPRKDSGANGLAHPRAAWIFIAVMAMLFALAACEGNTRYYTYGPDTVVVDTCDCDGHDRDCKRGHD